MQQSLTVTTYNSTVTEDVQKYTDLKEELTGICQLNVVYIVLTVLSRTDMSPKKPHDSLKLPNLRPALYILMQKAVMFNTCHVVGNFLAE
jgi:hypothetical protein